MHKARVKKTKPIPSPAEPMWPFPRTMALYLDLKIVLSGSLSPNCLHPHVNKSTGKSIKNVKCGLQPLLFVFMLVAMWIATLHVYLIILFSWGDSNFPSVVCQSFCQRLHINCQSPFYQNEESDWSDDVNRWIVTSHQIAINARHDQIYFWWWVVGPLPLAIFFYLDPSNNEKKKRFASRRIDLHVMD
jgi:hypothetical protein